MKSAAMDAINAKITSNCSATSGNVAVGTGEAFVNTMIDGVAGGEGFYTPEAQLGAFNAAYTRGGGMGIGYGGRGCGQVGGGCGIG